MNRAKYLTLIFGLSAPLLFLLNYAKPRTHHTQKLSSARVASPSRPAEIPAAALPVISATLGRNDSGYRVRATARGLHAANPRQNFSSTFTPGGVTIRTADAHVRMRVAGYGHGEQLKAVSASTPRADANRIEYRRGALTEWYVNGPMGLEQGFTLNEPPEGAAREPLRIALEYSGDVIASAAKNGESVSFLDRAGKPNLQYAGLAARDADQRALPSWMELQTDRLILAVDDSAARYPVTVDPTYSQTAILTDPSGAANERLGESVSVDDAGDTIVTFGNAPNAAHVFENSGSAWTDTSITPSTGVASAAISGDGKTIVLGDCSNATCLGHTRVYEKPGASWAGAALKATLSPATALVGARFGIAVAIDDKGDTIAVGSPCESTSLNGSSPICGEVHVYAKPSTDWADTSAETAVLSVAFPQDTNKTQCLGARVYSAEVRTLGISVAMDAKGDTIVAGAKDDFGCQPGTPGAAYVFVMPKTIGWDSTSTPSATLSALSGKVGDQQGISVALSGDGKTAVVGAGEPGDFGAVAGHGAAYVFLEPVGGWEPRAGNEDAKLTASNGANGDQFGHAVSVSNDGSTVVAASPARPFVAVSPPPNPLEAYVFFKPSGGWISETENQALPPTAGMDINGVNVTPGAAESGSFPHAFLSISSDATTIGAGGRWSQVGTKTAQGAVFVFSLPPCANPTITPPLSPASAAAGSAGFTLTVNGTNFASGAVVKFNGIIESTTGNATQLTAQISATAITVAGHVNVTVTNPGGCNSASADFTITNPPPVIAPPLAPSSATAGGATFTLTVNGTKFLTGAVVNFDGTAEITTFKNSTQLTASIPATSIATGGTVNVTVTNPDGLTSTSAPFTINNPTPQVTSFSPRNHPAGAGFTITVNGTGFIGVPAAAAANQPAAAAATAPASVVIFNGNNEPTTFINSTQVTAAIPDADVKSGGSDSVAVQNPTPGGGSGTATATFTLDDYSLAGPTGGASVTAGDTVTIPITISPSNANGFPNPVTAFSVTGLPAHTTSSFDMSSVTPGTTAQTVKLMITTKKNAGALPRSPSSPLGGSRILFVTGEFAALLLGLLAFWFRRRDAIRWRSAACVYLLAVMLGAATIAGCSGGNGGGGGTPTGDFPLTISATSGSDTKSTPVTLTVN